MSSAASRLVTLTNKASLQNLIQRHLLRPSAVGNGSVTQLLNKVTDNRTPYLNALQAHSFDASDAEAMKKKYSSGLDLSMIMFGQSGINQSENVKIHVRRRADTDDDSDDDFDSDTDTDSGDEGFNGLEDDDYD